VPGFVAGHGVGGCEYKWGGFEYRPPTSFRFYFLGGSGDWEAGVGVGLADEHRYSE